MMKMTALGDKFRHKGALAQAARLKSLKKGGEYLNSKHFYALFDGDTDTGERAEMDGRTAKLQNEVFASMFREDIRAEIDANVPFGKCTSKLRRWKWLKDHEVPLTPCLSASAADPGG